MKTIRLITAFLTAAVICADGEKLEPPAQAGPSCAASVAVSIRNGKFTAEDFIAGDLLGLRPKLVDSGVTPFLFYDGIFGANVSGGLNDDQAYAGQAYFGINLDLEKLLGWENTTVKISGADRHGESVRAEVGSVYNPQTIFGQQATYLYQVYIEKEFSEKWSVKLGRISAATDFFGSPLFHFSLNNATNGPLRATILEDSIVSLPHTVWGGIVRYKPDKERQFRLGVYQTGDRQTDPSLNGVDLSIRSGDGISVVAQYDWMTKINGRDSHFFVGAVSSFRDFDNFDGVSSTDLLFRTYAYGDIEVADGLKAFALASYADQDGVAVTPLQISGGLNYSGLIPDRKADHTFLHATYGRLSNKLGDSRGQNVSSESVYELGHRFQVAPAAYFQPSIQYIQRPGGTGNIDDAIILGASVGLAF